MFDRERFVTIVTGDIVKLIDDGVLARLGVDVVVSLENTYLQLDSYFATSISGKLRYLDAGKSAGGRLQDHMGKGLDEEIQARNIILPVAPGTVIPTRTHELANQGIKIESQRAALRQVAAELGLQAVDVALETDGLGAGA